MPKYNDTYEVIIYDEHKREVLGARTAKGHHLKYVGYRSRFKRRGYLLTYLPTGHNLDLPGFRIERLRDVETTAVWVDEQIERFAAANGQSALSRIGDVATALRSAWKGTKDGQTIYTEDKSS